MGGLASAVFSEVVIVRSLFLDINKTKQVLSFFCRANSQLSTLLPNFSSLLSLLASPRYR